VLLLYVVLVAPGPKIVPALGAVGAKDFPAEGWALLAAVILAGVGLAPDAVKWVNIIEDQLRRFVHEWFLVPDGIEQTIGVLEDARYDPPYSQLNLLESTLRETLQEDLKLDPGTLRHSWAPATILLTSLKQVGAGAVRPLQRAAFDPFREDLKALLVTDRALKPDVQARADNQVGGDQDDDLAMSVNTLLNRVYAYIRWGVLRQAPNERDVDQTLEELDFRIPKIFDTVAPAILLVALITIAFWVAVDTVNWALDRSALSTFRSMSSDSIVAALSSAMTASAMYGCVVLNALKRSRTES
jgi:hypothetical protein